MPITHDTLAFAPLVGTPREVKSRLDASKADQVIVLPVKTDDARQAGVMAEALTSIAVYLADALKDQNEQTLKALVNAVVPKVPPTPNLMKEAAMVVRARKAVLGGADWLTAAQVAELAGLSPGNPSTQPNKWKRQRQIFALSHNGVDYYPGYGLDPDAGYRPRKALRSILEIFGERKDGWGLAYWFLAANSFLGGRCPQDVLAVDPGQVAAAARDEVEDVAHA